MDDRRRREYMTGMCDAMGIALHRLTGLPLVKLVARKRNTDPLSDFEWEEEASHIAVRRGTMLLDAAGWIAARDARATALFTLAPPFQVAVEPIDEEEAAELFTVEGVTEEQIEEAAADAIDDPVLAPIVAPKERAKKRRRP